MGKFIQNQKEKNEKPRTKYPYRKKIIIPLLIINPLYSNFIRAFGSEGGGGNSPHGVLQKREMSYGGKGNGVLAGWMLELNR